jgi:hypothetical protein
MDRLRRLSTECSWVPFPASLASFYCGHAFDASAITQYWSRMEHTALDKSARALRQDRLLQIRRELSELMKRCA